MLNADLELAGVEWPATERGVALRKLCHDIEEEAFNGDLSTAYRVFFEKALDSTGIESIRDKPFADAVAELGVFNAATVKKLVETWQVPGAHYDLVGALTVWVQRCKSLDTVSDNYALRSWVNTSCQKLNVTVGTSELPCLSLELYLDMLEKDIAAVLKISAHIDVFTSAYYFHGTTQASVSSIGAIGIQLDKSTGSGDFGKAFYMTTSFRRALQHAAFKGCIGLVVLCAPETPTAPSFDFGAEPTPQWAEFVAACRNPTESNASVRAAHRDGFARIHGPESQGPGTQHLQCALLTQEECAAWTKNIVAFIGVERPL